MTSPFRVYIVTYNIGGIHPPDQLNKLLQLDSKDLPNLYAIGLQELNSSPTAFLRDAVYDDPWTNDLTDCLNKKGYVRIKSVRMLGLHLAVFVQRRDLSFIQNVQSVITPTGFSGVWGNKGGVSIRMDISGINICFVNCHLAAHLTKVSGRVEDFNNIVESQKFSDPDANSILDHDYVFWMGDLNFRLDDIPRNEVVNRIQAGDLDSLWKYDQLLKLLKDQLILIDFEEGPLTFPPTYKFDKGTDVYDTSAKQRKPGWCDRILWMVHEDAFSGCELDTQLMTYHSLMEYRKSDHKPVVGEYIIQVLASPPEPPVMFEPMDTWIQSKDQKICYSITSDYKPHSYDWIGLYRKYFKHPHDYVTYQWAPTEGDSMEAGCCLYEVIFDHGYFRDFDGTFCLCYYSYKNDCFVGYSDTFQISVREETSSDSSLSSDEFTEEGTGKTEKRVLTGLRKNKYRNTT